MLSFGKFKAHSRQAAAPGLWGDGFAGDSFTALRSMASWNECSSDEYTLLFPRLLPSYDLFPSELLGHLETCVAVRAWRLKRLDSAIPAVVLRSRVSAQSEQIYYAWFTTDSAISDLTRKIGLIRVCSELIKAEILLLSLLDNILYQLQNGFAPVWKEDQDAWFAFGSGIHPAYLWPKSAIAPARGYTAAWLGHLNRGRTALMPEAVAEYLLDAVLDGACSRDHTLVEMVGSAKDARRLSRAAKRRLACGYASVRFTRGRHRNFALVRELCSVARGREHILEHV